MTDLEQLENKTILSVEHKGRILSDQKLSSSQKDEKHNIMLSKTWVLDAESSF